jgi:hypothetical protein
MNELQTTHEAASSPIALINQKHSTNFQELEEMHEHLQKKAEITKIKQKNMIGPTKLRFGIWLSFMQTPC